MTKAPTREVTKVASDNMVRNDDPVAVAAYFKAEKRNFSAGHELEDWFEAEAEVAAKIEKA